MIPTKVFHSIACCVAILSSFCISAQQKDIDSLKTYYYMWTANKPGKSATAWGEYSIDLGKRPTEKEVKTMVIKKMGKNDWVIKYLRIEMIIEFDTAEEYYKWHTGGFEPATLARQIYIYRKNK